MFDKFADYMWYLLPSAFKRQKKKNQFTVYCKIIGNLYDTLMQALFRLREESILETCSNCMLEVFGNDYDMMQMKGETYEAYRKRLQMKALVAEKAGTLQGILYAMASVGYANCTITPFYLTDPERWAEIRINVYTGSVDDINTIDFSCVVSEVMKVKKASTLPHYRFYYAVVIIEQEQERIILKNIQFVLAVPFWYTSSECRLLDGSWLLDGSVMLDTKRRYGLALSLESRFKNFNTSEQIKISSVISKAQVENNHMSLQAGIIHHWDVNFWDNVLLNGAWKLDGCVALDSKRRYGLALNLRYESELNESEQETVTNGTVETRTKDYWFLNGEVKLDGTRKLNSIYRKEGL